MLKTYVDWLGPALLDASACLNSSAIDYQQSTVSKRRHMRRSDRVDLARSTRADALDTLTG